MKRINWYRYAKRLVIYFSGSEMIEFRLGATDRTYDSHNKIYSFGFMIRGRMIEFVIHYTNYGKKRIE